MAKLVFILGAGASALGNCPVMANFMQIMRRLATSDRDGSFAEHFQRVSRAQGLLQRSQSKARIDLDNIESLFSALEMAELLGCLGDCSKTDVSAMLKSFKRSLAETLDRTQKFMIRRASSDGEPIIASGPAGYIELAGLMNTLLTETPHHSVGCITFNYDLGLDVAMLSHGLDVNYGMNTHTLAGIAPLCKPGCVIPVCKLHGSLNWFQTPSSDGTNGVQFFHPLEMLDIQNKGSGGSPQQVTFSSSQALNAVRERLGLSELEALLVPPTESKSEHRKSIARVWSSAYKLLSEADHVVVCGYSMPDSDLFFRNFFALSMISDVVMRRFHIVDIQPTNVVQRFRPLLGTSIIDRPDVFGNTAGNLSDAVNLVGRWYRESDKLM